MAVSAEKDCFGQFTVKAKCYRNVLTVLMAKVSAVITGCNLSRSHTKADSKSEHGNYRCSTKMAQKFKFPAKIFDFFEFFRQICTLIPNTYSVYRGQDNAISGLLQ